MEAESDTQYNNTLSKSGYYASSPGSALAMSLEYIGNIQSSSYENNLHTRYVPGISLVVSKLPQVLFRFRYKSERCGTGSSFVGKDSSREVKTFSTVQVMGVETLKPNNPTIRIRCTLYQADRKNDELPHSHKLVMKSGDHEKYDPHFIEADAQNGYTVEFRGMSIIQTKRKDIVTELQNKLIRLKEFELERDLTPLEQEKELTKVKQLNVKSMNLNQVCLCFEAFCYDRIQSRWFKICPSFISDPINNTRNALTGELKICKYSTCVSTVSGNQEVYLLVKKVNRDDIKVRFFDNDGWQDFARIDTVHHQYAMVIKTPPYKSQTITKPVQVLFELYRTKDHCTSMPHEFTYKPNDTGESSYGAGQKRKIEIFEEPVNPTVIEPVKTSITSYDDDLDGIDWPGTYLNIPLNREFNQIVQQVLQENSLSEQEMGQSPNRIEYDSVDVDERSSKTRLDPKITEKPHFLHNYLVRFIKNGVDESFANVMSLVKNHNFLQNLLWIRDGNDGLNLINLCCVYGQGTYLKEFIDSDTDLKVVDNNGNNPVHVCVAANQLACLKVLLAHTSKLGLELKNYKGLTALHLAVKCDTIVMIKTLVEHGASLFAIESHTLNTVLHTAVEQSSLEMIKYILENTGTQLLNKFNGSDKTPLDIFYDADEPFDETQQKVVKCLLDNGGWSSHINENESGSNGDESMTNEASEDDDVREKNINYKIPYHLDGTTSVDEIDALPSSFRNLSIYKTPENPIKFDAIAKDQLCTILNTTESWRQCATLLDLENLYDIWGRQDNPSECLLAYIEGCKFELQAVIDTLQSLDLKDAISVVDAMVARQLS